LQNSDRPITTDNAPENKLRGYVLTALFAGTAAAAGYLLMLIPNIEAITAILFCAGYAVGIKRGILAAITAAILYFGLNPQGGFFPPLLIAQIIGIAAAPIAGFFYRSLPPGQIKKRIFLVFSALIVTLWYDLLTNISFPLVAGLGFKGITTMLVAGIIPSIIHISGNIIVFNLIIPPIVTLINRSFPVT